MSSELIESIANNRVLDDRHLAQLVTRRMWGDQFRGLINAAHPTDITKTEEWSTARSALRDIHERGTGAASQHALMGVPEDCYGKGKVLPYLESRILRLAEIFTDLELTIHIAVTSQFDHLYETTRRSPDAVNLAGIQDSFSWVDIVNRIQAVAPSRPVVVWDFEEPRKVALCFIISLLNVNNNHLIDKLKQHLNTRMQGVSPLENSPSLAGVDSGLIAKLDHQYALDLVDLARLSGVTLVSPNTVPSYLYI